MKRTISHEAQAACTQLRNMGVTPVHAPPSCNGANPFTVLGLSCNARWSDVRLTFVSLVRQYSPEQHPQEFMLIVDAYETLKRAFRSVQGVTENANNADTGKRRRVEGGNANGIGVVNSFAPTAPTVIALDHTGRGHIMADRACGALAVETGGLQRTTTCGYPSVQSACGVPGVEMGALQRSTTFFGHASAPGMDIGMNMCGAIPSDSAMGIG